MRVKVRVIALTLPLALTLTLTLILALILTLTLALTARDQLGLEDDHHVVDRADADAGVAAHGRVHRVGREARGVDVIGGRGAHLRVRDGVRLGLGPW